MRRCFQFLSFALMLGFSVDAFAAARPMVPSKDAILPDGGDVITPLAVILSTGFEAGEGFILGPLEPQNGWTASGVNSPWASVSALNPAVGTQHARLIRDTTVGAGSQRLILSPATPLPPNTPAQFKGLVYISNDGGADHTVFGQAPSQAFITFRVLFSFSDISGGGPGTIFILDNPGAGLEFVDTGVLWNQNVYTELKVQLDPAAAEIRYFYGGVQIYTGAIYAGTAVEQVGAITDNFQLAGEHAGLDGLQLLDTPSDPVPASPTTWGKIKGQYR